MRGVDQTLVRTEPDAGAGAVGGAAASIDGVLAGLDGAQNLVAMASQAPLAGADGDVLAQVIAAGGRLRSSVEALLLAATSAMEACRAGSGRAALRNEARMSARSASRKAAVSEQISQMPNVARGLACGALTIEHVEVLADTARRSSPDVVDATPELLETAAKASPDVLRRQARDFLAQHDAAAAESQLSRQRRERSAALFIDDETGMGVLNARFDPVNFALVRQAVENYNDALWRQDGGRDGKPGAVRDNRQRLADSVFEMLTNRNALAVWQQPATVPGGAAPALGGLPIASAPGPSSVPSVPREPAAVLGGAAPAPLNPPAASAPEMPAVPGECSVPAVPGDGVGISDGECRSVNQWAPAQAPNQLVIVADIGVIDGTAPDGRCEVLGAGPVPTSILDNLSPDTRITGALFAGPGRPLWLGRSRRHATAAQQLMIAVRDRGCVLCGKPMHRCRYHHIDEWDADNGKTDIDNLAALCTDCHNSLHKAGQRLCQDPANGHWSTQKRSDGLSPRKRPASPRIAAGRSPP